MKYPRWSPPSLVEDLNRRRDPKTGVVRPSPLAIDSEDEILHRLLTNTEMESAWRTINQTPIVEGLPRILATADNADALWWAGLKPGLEHFERTPKRTFAQNKRALSKLANMTRSLVTAIRNDPVASEQIRFLIQKQVGEDRNEYCITGLDEAVPWHDLDVPSMAIWSDAGDAQKVLRRGLMDATDVDEESRLLLEKKDGTYWKFLPEIERFAYWTCELGELEMLPLLERFSTEMESIANGPVAISQPGRQDAGRLPFIIRWMSGYMWSRYGKPLDDTVAIIVSVALDLPEMLTRESVRAYVKSAPEKKAAQLSRKSPRPK